MLRLILNFSLLLLLLPCTAEAETTTSTSAAVATASTAAERVHYDIGDETVQGELSMPSPRVGSARAAATATVARAADPAGEDELPLPPDTENIVITGSRRARDLADVTVTTELLTREELFDSGAENLTELLEEHPGVELERSTRGTSIRLMGLNPEHVLILVDGQRVTGRVGGGVDPFRFNLENIEQVEIVKGAGSAIYGSEAIGGVINIITRRQRAPITASSRVTYGSFNTVDAIAATGFKAGDFSTHFSGGLHRSDGFTVKNADGTPNLQTTAAEFTGYNVSNNSRYDFTDAFSLLGNVDYRSFDQTANDQFGNSTSLREQRQETFSVSVNPVYQTSADGQLKAKVSYSSFRFQIAQQAEQAVEDIRQKVGHLTIQADQLDLDTHMLSIGLEAIFEDQGGELIEGGLKDRGRFAVFIQDEWTPFQDELYLSIVPSVRVDVDSQFGSVMTPRFAVRFDPLESLQFRASFGFGFRAPTFEELYLDFQNPGSGYFVRGNTELIPERSRALNLTATFAPIEMLSLSVMGFYIDLDNLIATVRGPVENRLSRFDYNNVAEARTYGVEASVDIRPIEILALRLGYTFNPTENLTTGQPLPDRAKHKGTARVSFTERDFGTQGSVRASFFGERVFFDSNGQPDPGDGSTFTPLPQDPYVTVDLRLQQQIYGPLALFAGLENLFDVGDPDFLPITPRSFYGGISADFTWEEKEPEGKLTLVD